MSITQTPIDGQQDLSAQQAIVRQNADGPICMLGAFQTTVNPTQRKNMLTSELQGAADKNVVLQIVPAGQAPSLAGHVLVCCGRAFVGGALQGVAVFRPV